MLSAVLLPKSQQAVEGRPIVGVTFEDSGAGLSHQPRLRRALAVSRAPAGGGWQAVIATQRDVWNLARVRGGSAVTGAAPRARKHGRRLHDGPGGLLTFFPLAHEHLAMLHEWLRRPHVATWWGEAETPAQLLAAYLGNEGQPNATRAFIAALDGVPIGFIQRYVVKDAGDGWWQDETDPGARGIDQFLADPGLLGQGLGRAVVRAFVQQTFEDPAVTVVQTDPHPSNLRAIRCYEGAGFVRVGLVTTPDGEALLMRRTR